ncbi:hypothetical protein [Sphingobium yanoikuyae]|uniref:Uncharacterized protein n=1 Tax=Sphingobium yanoikuyae TaxID=13690 RepID=A0A291MXZ0_SPHYA|nr:hypothetical protein [Sphingobium yanoikuyae]ATI79952.1 hypothetical protein A6768_07965 [Sphingobium yanoikuyae]
MSDIDTEDGSAPKIGEIANLGDPILLNNLNLAGISAEAAQGGQKVQIWTRMALTSDQDLFQRIIGYIASVIEHAANHVGAYPRLNRAQNVFLVMRPDNSGELWVDTAAIATYHAIKRPGPIFAGTVIFENDVADLTGLWFPRVEVGPQDRILAIIREGWRFALYFDFNPDGELAIEEAKRALGTLYRRMRYADLYSSLAHEPTFKGMVGAGWFPFLELGITEIRTLLGMIEAEFPLDETEQNLISAFDDKRLERMFSRWMERAHLKEREMILRPAINAFKNSEPVTVIKIILSEIEGVMSDAYFQVHGERPYRASKLPGFMIEQAEQRAGGKDTLFFPVEFGQYLKDYTYADFKPDDLGTAGSRHAVSHGRVPGSQYTMARALQALLTLDQLAFYM